MEKHLRPGAYKGHIPFKHVKELGQFVQAELADKAAEVGLAGVVVLGPAGLLLYIDPHGAELVHHEGLFVEADALLLEDCLLYTSRPSRQNAKGRCPGLTVVGSRRQGPQSQRTKSKRRSSS